MKLTRHTLFNSILTCILLAMAASLQAQQVTGTPGSPGATTTIDGQRSDHARGDLHRVLGTISQMMLRQQTLQPQAQQSAAEDARRAD